jgi:hypothetical protein
MNDNLSDLYADYLISFSCPITATGLSAIADGEKAMAESPANGKSFYQTGLKMEAREAVFRRETLNFPSKLNLKTESYISTLRTAFEEQQKLLPNVRYYLRICELSTSFQDRQAI